ncbi:MAG TPA: PilZ domain-containing protein [Candidatus Omnitrophota bacterium]|jgi:c-di-GMP-binding flagellar brake protein YcgR|nr:PilZ domain-containing protein [Candidatus Omnitrophota bacterium]
MVAAFDAQRERRKFKRLRVNLAIVFRINNASKMRMVVENKEIRATMIDLSEGGLAILTNYDLPEDSILSMKFTLFKVDSDDVSFYGPMEIEGTVRYRQILANNEYRLGIVFTSIEKNDSREIDTFVKNST